jgi:hypothetical protein
MMRWLIPVICAQLVLLPACAAKQGVETSPLPEIPTNEAALEAAKAQLPPEPAKIPQDKNWAVGLEATEDHPEGILISHEKAAQASEYAIRYQGLRDWTTLKIASWAVQEAVYHRNLAEADLALEAADERAQRTWWEKHGPQVGFLLGGLAVGLTLIGFQAALNGVESGQGQ